MITITLVAKMIIASTILYGYYWLFLRNKRFHHYNRFYLLGATGASIVVPYIRIPIVYEPDTPSGQIVYRSIDIISASRWEDELVEKTTSGFLSSLMTIQTAVFALYVTGVSILLYILIRSLVYIHNLSKKYSYEYVNALRLYNTREPGTPFSFFRSIFWNSDLDLNSKEGQQIFRHELFHVKQRHSSDILFLECVSIFLWFNPFFHIIKREIKAIHEFLADQHSVSDNNQHDYAELLIIQSINAKKSSLSNYFFQTHIKRRIAMITDFKTKKYNYWTRIMVLPLSVLLFCAIALYAKTPDPSTITNQVQQTAPQKLAESLTVLVDAGHGGEDPGAKNEAGLQEKDLALAIARQIKLHASSYNMNIVMTRNEDNYPSLKERTELAMTEKADIIISVHLAATEKKNTNSGFDIYITNKNKQTVGQSKLLGQNIASQIKGLYAIGPIKQSKENGIWILDAAPCPAVLIECGYITNEEDVLFISKPENQEKIAKSILQGIVRYKSGESVKTDLDTIPVSKKEKKGVNVKSIESNSQREHQIPQEKMADSREQENRHKKEFPIQKQEMELEHRKRNEARVIEMKNEQRVLQQKQQELDHQKKDESRVSEIKKQQLTMKQKQQEIALNQRKMDKSRIAEMRDNEPGVNEKQQEIQLKQEMLNKARQDEMQARERSQDQKQEEMKSKRYKIEEEKALKMENEQRIHIQKQHKMELEQSKNKEAQIEIEGKKPAEPEPKARKASPGKKLKEFEAPQKPTPTKKEFF